MTTILLKIINIIYDMGDNVITIVDCFISNNHVLSKLKTCIDNLKSHDNKILLVSNTTPPTDILESVDYFFYNHQNRLFTNQYDDVAYCDLWKKYDNIVIHEITEEFQKHGLSVLCNLFNCLDLSKSLGFSHFQRVEVDDLYTNSSYEFMKTVPSLCKNENKKSLFYKNDNDVSFHYYFSEINFFLENFYRIRNENDYKKYLKLFGHNISFKPVEVYMLDNINRIDDSEIIIKNGTVDMLVDFEGTVWNTESSKSTLHEKYEGCSTKIYNIENQNGICILSFNHNNFPVKRKIDVELENGSDTLVHNLENFSYWSYNIFYDLVKSIKVYDYETGRFLYEMENKNIKDYIELK